MNIAYWKRRIDANRRNHENTSARKGWARRRYGANNRTNEIEEREAHYVNQLVLLCKELGCPVPDGYGKCENSDATPGTEICWPQMTVEATEFLDQIHRAGGNDGVMMSGPIMREELGYDHAEVQFCIQAYLTERQTNPTRCLWREEGRRTQL
jgi:hypothetical protein